MPCSTARNELIGALVPFCVESCLLYTSDAADERSSVDLGGRRIIKKKKNIVMTRAGSIQYKESESEQG